MTATPSNTPNKGRSLDRQITAKDVDCLKEAFALFDIESKVVITAMELGKVYLKMNLLKNVFNKVNTFFSGPEKVWVQPF